MKITVLNGNMPNYDFGLSRIIKMIGEILLELGVTLNEINLSFSDIPHYDGITSKAVEDILLGMTDSSGVIFASTASLFAPTAIMQSFLEHLKPGRNNPLAGKNCLMLVISESGGERSALQYLSQVINYFGGFDSVKIGLDAKSAAELENVSDEAVRLKGIIEKQVEDFYRLTRQNRQFIIPRDYREALGGEIDLPIFTEDEYEHIKQMEKKVKTPVSELYKKLDLDAFNEQQEQDIEEITQYFAKKLSSGEEEDRKVLIEPFAPKGTAVKPRAKTCKQLSQCLPHYFQPQLAGGLVAVIQLSISGNESFDGYLSIRNTECRYTDGQADSPDITIISSSELWMDVLKNKCTAQKAFMIGRLKVRGNFVLLTKFDQLFKLGV